MTEDILRDSLSEPWQQMTAAILSILEHLFILWSLLSIQMDLLKIKIEN